MSNQIMRKFEVVKDILTTPNDIGEYKTIELWCNQYRMIEDIENELMREYGYRQVRHIPETEECSVCHLEFDYGHDMVTELNPKYTSKNNQPRFTSICLKCKCLRQQRDIEALSDAVVILQEIIAHENFRM